MIRGVREEGREEVEDFIAIFCHLSQYSCMTN